VKNISSSKSSTVDLSVISKNKPVTKIVGIIFMGLSLAVTVMPAAMAKTFSIDGMALNTNNNFPRKDGQPIMSTWKLNPNDNDQQFDRQGNLLRHRSTGKCLNANKPSVGSAVNVWPCNGNDGDQQFSILSAGGNISLIQRKGTTLCLDMDSRNANTRMKLWNCNASFANQRFVSNASINPPPPPPSGQITLPFKSGQTWHVCQGYNGPISHQNYYALDLSIGRDIGSTACYAADGNVSRSANQPVTAPVGGKIYHVNTDLVCLSIDNNRSLLLGHMNQRVANGSVVRQGDVLGYISPANNANGGFSHIHLEGRKSSNCAIGTSTPLTGANGLQLIGIGDLPGNVTHFGKSLTRP
jgi:murein DD-endopeptidase MepM/ murein hydrolase activator NlpD